MKKYMQPSIEVIEMELTNCVMNGSDPSISQKGDYESTQPILSGRRRGDDWSNYEGLE